MSGNTGSGGSTSWARRYPPLSAFAMAMLVAALILPSALNVPQANPTEVVEFAPVPPEDDSPPPPQEGSISQLGLGTTSTLTTGIDDPPDIPQPPGEEILGRGERPATKRCVGNPPRQTEDPNAPPCVAYWEGDNHGETWQGVDGETITILLYATTFASLGGSEGSESTPAAGRYCDVDGTPPDSDPDNCFDRDKELRDHSLVRVTRAISRYFNERFQTYDRRAHFWIYWSGARSASARRADAHDNWERLRPFAVVDYAFFGGHNEVYAEAMTRRQTMVFGNFGALPNAYYRNFRPFIWNFWPDVERWLENYISYVCQKVAPYPVSHGGIPGNIGEERRYALLRSDDPLHEGLRMFGRIAAQRLQEEGCPDGTRLNIVDSRTFPRHQYSIDTHPAARPTAEQNIASFMANQATTILWLGGFEVQHSQVADERNYYPEIVVAGDLLNDVLTHTRWQNQDVWRHAWVATNQLREDHASEAPCRMAYREGNPGGTNSEENEFCDLYRPFFMVFRGIQAAGPRLTPYTVEQGNHAIPRQASTSPHVGACFFETNDYTCVKDAHEAWWDSDAPDPNGNPDESGCYRMVREGFRYLAWEWAGGGNDVFTNGANDPCNNVRSASVYINPYGPEG